jgi:hypothetical protein
VNVTLAVFIRADIFGKVLERAREADKLLYTRLTWNDPELLFRVIEERYEAYEASHEGAAGAELWSLYFCRTVKGIPTKDYLIAKILPRPRDMVYLVKAAVSKAVNRRHSMVKEEDILDAETEYSQYALKSILVENGVTLPELESILYEFAGTAAIVTEQEVRSTVLVTINSTSWKTTVSLRNVPLSQTLDCKQRFGAILQNQSSLLRLFGDQGYSRMTQ